jgi:hypothetical protein
VPCGFVREQCEVSVELGEVKVAPVVAVNGGGGLKIGQGGVSPDSRSMRSTRRSERCMGPSWCSRGRRGGNV